MSPPEVPSESGLTMVIWKWAVGDAGSTGPAGSAVVVVIAAGGEEVVVVVAWTVVDRPQCRRR